MPAEVETMMYTQEVPWHGLGRYVGEEPILSEDAIIAAGLDWHVEKCEAGAIVNGEEVFSDEFFLNVRTSDLKVLGSVEGRYQVLQNCEAFEFMDSLAGPENLVRYHTAGSLKGGRHIWLLAEIMGLTIEPLPGDETQPYILLVNGHDGRMPLKALFTSVRVVCQNTLNMALHSAKGGVTIRHTGDMQSKVKAAREVLGLARDEFTRYGELADVLAGKKMDDKMFKTFLDSLIPIKHDEDTRSMNMQEKVIELYESGPGTDIVGVTGTAWGALQAVTDFTAHHRTTRGAGSDEMKKREKRLESVWFGSGNNMNQKAIRLLAAA